MSATTTYGYTSNTIVQTHLDLQLKNIEAHLDVDCLAYVGPIAFGSDDQIRRAVEGLDQKKNKLLVILETPGGYAEVAKRMSDTFRHHYKVVDFLVPGYAMSAGTILAMSGDAIHMNYYSVLGPIDPQAPGPDGRLIPALGYLIRYEELLAKGNKGRLSDAEMNILLSFDQILLYSYEQARDLSLSLLEEWLVKYKFKDWMVTEGTKKKVTAAMKKKRAKEIAQKLNDVKVWNSHGIGINMERLRRDLNLKIDDFALDGKLDMAVKIYYGLLTDFMARMTQAGVIHTRRTYLPLS
jgi:membrane-bound ClpP family serine protease